MKTNQLVISLTAIPPRFPYLRETLQSLLNQKARVSSVNLYLPRNYRRFAWDPSVLPEVPQGVNIRLVDQDYGPATKVLPAVFGVLAEGGEVVCLIKPQFELEREDVGRGGIVREEELRERAVEKIRRFVTENHGREWKGVIPASIAGTDGNQEFLAWIG